MQANLDYLYPMSKMLVSNPIDLFHMRNFLYAREGDEIVVALFIPVAMFTENAVMYSIFSTPLAVPTNDSLVTNIKNLGKAILLVGKTSTLEDRIHQITGQERKLSESFATYAVLENSFEIQIKENNWIYLKDIQTSLRNREYRTCERAMYMGYEDEIRELCKFKIAVEELVPAIVNIDNELLLMRNMQKPVCVVLTTQILNILVHQYAYLKCLVVVLSRVRLLTYRI